MRQKTGPAKSTAEQVEARRATRRQFSAEDKIRIALEGLRGEDSIAELPYAGPQGPILICSPQSKLCSDLCSIKTATEMRLNHRK